MSRIPTHLRYLMDFIFPVDNNISSTENYYDDKKFNVKAYISFIGFQLTSVMMIHQKTFENISSHKVNFLTLLRYE